MGTIYKFKVVLLILLIFIDPNPGGNDPEEGPATELPFPVIAFDPGLIGHKIGKHAGKDHPMLLNGILISGLDDKLLLFVCLGRLGHFRQEVMLGI